MPNPPPVPDPPPVSDPETINQKMNKNRPRSDIPLDIAWKVLILTGIFLVLAVITGYSVYKWLACMFTVIAGVAIVLSFVMSARAGRSHKRGSQSNGSPD